MACCLALQQRPRWAAPRASLPLAAAFAATARRPPAAWRSRFPAVAAQAAGDDSSSKAASSSNRPGRRGRPSLISQDSKEDIAAARQRLQAYLQQQRGISGGKAAELAGKLSAKLGGAADQQVPPPMQWLVGSGMQPVKAAQLVAHICESGTGASFIRQWPTWQPVFAVNWQLADSCLAAYQQQCRETKQRALKGSESMAALLSSQPSKYPLLLVPDLGSRLTLPLQQLGLTDAEVGQMVAGGLAFSGPEATLAAAIQWLASFAGSREAATAMLRGAPELLSYSAATLDSKVAALQAAWAGTLRPQQVQQLVQRAALVLQYDENRYQPAADVLCSWFPQFDQLLAAVTAAPQLLGASADILQANERWFTGPPLSLSRQQFLARVRAAPQAFTMNVADAKSQHKLAFLTQVGGVPLEHALSANHLNYLKYSTTVLAGRYFLLAEHGVPLPRHKDGGIVLSYAAIGLQRLLRLMRPHDSGRRLPTEDDAALAYIDQWLKAWPEMDSGKRWAEVPPAATSQV